MTGSSQHNGSGPFDERLLGRITPALTVGLTLVDGRERCQLIDISLRGAKIASTMRATPGEVAVLRVADREMFGQVIWVDGRLIGLRFDDPLPKDFLLQAKTLTRDCEREDAQQAAQDWAEGRHKWLN